MCTVDRGTVSSTADCQSVRLSVSVDPQYEYCLRGAGSAFLGAECMDYEYQV